MATNTILTSDMITNEALAILHNKLSFVGKVNRQYDDSYARSGAKIGDSLRIRLPNEYSVRTGTALSANNTVENNTTLTVGTQKGVDMSFTTKELTMSMDDFSARIIEPAMAVLAANIEADAFNMYQDVYNQVGVAGTTPSTLKTYLDAKTKLNQGLAPKDDKRCIQLNSDASAVMVDALKGLFQSSSDIKKQYLEGVMGRGAGFDWFENELVPVHTNGTNAAAGTVNGAAQTGASLVVAGLTAAGTLTAGTVFTIAGVNRVHPETKADMGVLQQFVVTANATAAAGAATLAISPAIVTTGASQNVTAAPANGAARAWADGAANAANPKHLAFHKDAFAFATADLEMPDGVDFKARKQYDGISMRVVRQYDINTDTIPCRLDVLYGYKAIRPQLACRITG